MNKRKNPAVFPEMGKVMQIKFFYESSMGKRIMKSEARNTLEKRQSPGVERRNQNPYSKVNSMTGLQPSERRRGHPDSLVPNRRGMDNAPNL